MDRFEDMRCFVQVVDHGSVTRAAETLSIAPSAVSRRIKELENRLGVQLLARTTRRMSMTEAGRTFYARSLRILADVEEAEAEVSDGARALAGHLRVAAPLDLGINRFAPIIRDFVEAHPDVQVDLDLSDRIVDLVGEGFDLALRVGTLRDSSLIARRLGEVRMYVVAAPLLIDRLGRPDRPEMLQDWPTLAYVGSERFDIWRFTRPDGADGSVQLTVKMRANNGSVLAELAAAGLGVTMQPGFIVDEAIAAGRLVTLLEDHQWPALTLSALYPETRHLSAKARVFIDFIRARLGDARDL